MRLLLDNCVPRKLAKFIANHTVRTSPAEGLDKLADCDLLDAMEGRFDVLITVDRGIQHQQNIAGRTIIVGIIAAKSNRLADLKPFIDQLVRQIEQAPQGSVVLVP